VDGSWNESGRRVGASSAFRAFSCAVCAGSALGVARRPSLNPRVRGSSLWRRTRTDLLYLIPEDRFLWVSWNELYPLLRCTERSPECSDRTQPLQLITQRRSLLDQFLRRVADVRPADYRYPACLYLGLQEGQQLGRVLGQPGDYVLASEGPVTDAAARQSSSSVSKGGEYGSAESTPLGPEGRPPCMRHSSDESCLAGSQITRIGKATPLGSGNATRWSGQQQPAAKPPHPVQRTA
jgi:hypothetical protein